MFLGILICNTVDVYQSVCSSCVTNTTQLARKQVSSLALPTVDDLAGHVEYWVTKDCL